MPTALHRQIGQTALVGFDGYTLPPDLVALAREFDLGGVILFRRNVESPEQVAELACHAQQLAGDLPLWVAVDQEGGRVARLRRPFTEWPPMITLGRSADEELTRRFARALAIELRAVGISLDFAPVLDVHTNPKNPVIGDRALSTEAAAVATLGCIVARTLQECGIAACGKHFPGHGDTAIDSHLDLPVVEHPPDRLDAVEYVPFRAAIAADIVSIMTAHVLVPALDEQRPATLSRAIVDGVLRKRLGFEGVIFSDDLDMKAITGRMSRERAAVEAIGAGCDAVLLCGTDVQAHASALEAVIHAVEAEELPYARVEDAIARTRKAKARMASTVAPPDLVDLDNVTPLSPAWRPRSSAHLRALLGRESHQAIAERMRKFA